MASSVELLIKVLADTSHASAAFSGLTSNLGKALGFGVAGAAAGAVIADTTKAAMEFQSAMAVVQAGVNSVDFAPGTASFTAAKDQILKDSIALGVGFDHAADVYAQSVKFVNDQGEHLSTDKMQEYTDTMLRMEKVSQDHLSATDAGRQVDVFEKLYNDNDFAQVGSAVTAESQIHNQGEDTILQSANAIALYGAELGVTKAEAIGLGNALSDVGQGGQRGGSSVGRMFARMEASADSELDPEVKYADEKKKRSAQERLDDLQTSLKEADAQHAQMYGQHGLKTQYARNPEAVMAEEDRRAKLQREIADQQTDMAHDADAKKAGRGQMSVSEMAKTAGMDVNEYAELTKEDPAKALIKWVEGLSSLPEDQRAKAMSDAGVSNIKDQATISALEPRIDAANRMIEIAQQQLSMVNHAAGVEGPNTGEANLPTRAAIMLGTTESKGAQAAAVIEGGKAEVGEPARQGLDAFYDMVIKVGKESQDQSTNVGMLVAGLAGLGGVLSTVAPYLLPFVAQKMISGGGPKPGPAAPESATPGPAAPSEPGPTARAGVVATGAGALVAGGVAYLQIQDMKNSLDAYNNARQSVGLQPININIGDVISQGGSPDEMLARVQERLTTAWAAAMSTTPVSSTVGGNIGNMAPR